MSRDTFWISSNTPSSKNSRRWTGKYFIGSKATIRWQKETKPEWIEQKEEFLQAVKELGTPLYIELTFYRRTKSKFDYVNMSQIVLDAMVDYGWITDDNADEVKPYFGDYVYSKDDPGVKIKILKDKPTHYDNQVHPRTN